MSTTRKTPKLRFPEFTDDWEQRELGEIFKYEQPQPYIVSSTEYSDDYSIPVLTAGQSFILGYTNEDFGIKEASKSEPVVIFDDFTTSSQFVDFPFKVKSSAMKLLSLVNKKDNIHFAYNVLKNIDYKSVTHERHWISIFSKMSVLFPSCKEQEKIGAYFKSLDNLITLHQRELDSLKKLKKSLLQKMFPKNGEKIPELRFPEFTGDWEQRKLGYMTDSFSGGTPKVGNEEYYGGEIPFIRSAEINSSTTELYITKKGLDNSSAKMVSKGTILYALYGATSGECGISQIDGAINQAILAIKPKCGYVPYFISTWLRRSKFSIVSTFLQGGQGNLSGEIVKNLSLMLPCQNEQKKIGELFKKLDSTITLHQRELDTLKKLKKGLLQNMFV